MEALQEEGAEAVLREALTELEVQMQEHMEDSGSGSSSTGGGSSGGGSAGGSGEEDDEEGEEQEQQGDSSESAAMQGQYLQYVIALTADLLHHISIGHVEL